MRTKGFSTVRLLLLASVPSAFASAALAQGGPGFPPLTNPVAPPQNPTTPEKVVLGKMLFWEEQLSSDNTMACGTCHIPAAGGGEARMPLALHPGQDGNFGTPEDR